MRVVRHAILVAVLAAGASLAAGAQGAPPPLVVVGSANPATDPGNVQAAVNRARRTAGVGMSMAWTGVGPSLPRDSNTIADSTAANSADCSPCHIPLRRHSATRRSLSL